MQVAAMARQRQIIGAVRTAVLFGDDMFDVMLQLAELLTQAAVLATLVGTATDEGPLRLIHVLLNLGRQIAAGLQF